MSKFLGISTTGLILIIVLPLLLFGAWPGLGLVQFGYAPSGLLFVALLVLIVLIASGRI